MKEKVFQIDEVGVTKGTGYNWLEEWNEDEFDIERLKPDYDGGPKRNWANKTRERADQLNIILVFQPPYSPDLNPIEYIWKSIKQKISPLLIDTLEEFQKTIQKHFKELSKRMVKPD